MKTTVSSQRQNVPPPSNDGVVDWLLACPEKDFFVAIESESTERATGGGRAIIADTPWKRR